jgi:acyl carrier protein
MEQQEFLKNFSNQFDDTDISEISFETNFKELDEWSSLTALAVINMVGKKYGVTLRNEEMKAVNTIQDLYNIVNAKI